MPEENTAHRGLSIGDLANPEIISERVGAEEAGANFRRAVQELGSRMGHVRATADGVAVLGIGSVVKAAADAEAERVYREREETGRG